MRIFAAIIALCATIAQGAIYVPFMVDKNNTSQAAPGFTWGGGGGLGMTNIWTVGDYGNNIHIEAGYLDGEEGAIWLDSTTFVDGDFSTTGNISLAGRLYWPSTLQSWQYGPDDPPVNIPGSGSMYISTGSGNIWTLVSGVWKKVQVVNTIAKNLTTAGSSGAVSLSLSDSITNLTSIESLTNRTTNFWLVNSTLRMAPTATEKSLRIADTATVLNGPGNVAIGYRAAETNVDLSHTVLIGDSAGSFVSNNYATVGIGLSALQFSTNISSGVFLGPYSGYVARKSTGQIGIGDSAGRFSSNNNYTVAIGFYAGLVGTNSQRSVYVGSNAGENSSSSDATMLGAYAGQNATNSNYSVFIGARAGQDVTRQRTLIIDSGAASEGTNALLYGEFNNRFLRIGARLDVSNYYNPGLISMDAGNLFASGAITAAGGLAGNGSGITNLNLIDATNFTKLATNGYRSLRVTNANTLYTSVDSHINLHNTSASGQSVIAMTGTGGLLGKWRSDFAGNLTWVAKGRHDFFLGADYGQLGAIQAFSVDDDGPSSEPMLTMGIGGGIRARLITSTDMGETIEIKPKADVGNGVSGDLNLYGGDSDTSPIGGNVNIGGGSSINEAGSVNITGTEITITPGASTKLNGLTRIAGGGSSLDPVGDETLTVRSDMDTIAVFDSVSASPAFSAIMVRGAAGDTYLGSRATGAFLQGPAGIPFRVEQAGGSLGPLHAGSVVTATISNTTANVGTLYVTNDFVYKLRTNNFFGTPTVGYVPAVQADGTFVLSPAGAGSFDPAANYNYTGSNWFAYINIAAGNGGGLTNVTAKTAATASAVPHNGTIAGATVTTTAEGEQFSLTAGGTFISLNDGSSTVTVGGEAVITGSISANGIASTGGILGNGSGLTNIAAANWATNIHGYGRTIQYGGANLTNWNLLSTNAILDRIAEVTNTPTITVQTLYANTLYISNGISADAITAPTNPLPSMVLDMSKRRYLTNLSGDITFTGISGNSTTNVDTTTVVLDPSGANRAVNLHASWRTPDGLRAYTVTNGTIGLLTVECYGGRYTNAALKVFW